MKPQAKVNRQNTRHGKMDMPFSQLNKYVGMRHGGKVKRYAEGGHLENLDRTQSFNAAFKEAQKAGADTFTWVNPRTGKEGVYSTKMASSNRGAQEAGAKYAAAKRALATAPEGEGKRRLTEAVGNLRKDYERQAGTGKQYEKGMQQAGARYSAASQALQNAPSTFQGPGREALEKEVGGAKTAYEQSVYRKGGNVESKGMMKKEIAFMKKKGAPKSMIRHEEAEAKDKGYARGGGIESRGKTKGTVVRMASGGSVRGGGCEQRGKTKGKMV